MSTARRIRLDFKPVLPLIAFLFAATISPAKTNQNAEQNLILSLPGGAKLEMVHIPPGRFEMGSPNDEPGRSNDEGPIHTVNINYDFYIGKYLVTQAQWHAVTGNSPARRYGVGDNYPVYYVSWEDCQAFVEKLNRMGLPGTFRLPSEAEWEYACRAGTQTRYFFGDSIGCGDVCEDCEAGMLPGKRSDYMWYCANHGPAGSPDYVAKRVGQKLPNPFGLYDASGNLWEWCLDAYHFNYNGAPTDGSAWQGPPGSPRVLRGGAWDYHANYCRSAARNGYVSDRAYTFHGLRLVWFPYSKDSDEWFKSWYARQIADNILSYQNRYGSWPKNMNMVAHGWQGEKFTKNWGSTIDNNATTKELNFLAHVVYVTGIKRYKDSFNRGLDFLLQAQYDNGGWPQRYPPGHDYGDYITFNDNAMINMMKLMRNIVDNPRFSFVDDKRRALAKKAYEKGLDCILNCQVIVNGHRTIWAAQHDQKTLEPRSARAFELKGLCGGESTGITLFLMSIKNPSRKVVQAVEDAVAWFEKNKITGVRIVRKDGTKVLVKDPDAPALWARFYDIETSQPIFAGMDGKVKHSLKEIENERIIGYKWYVQEPAKVLREYPKWKKSCKE